jgi:decaprenyl-phosphate phosphoribosyltransferase
MINVIKLLRPQQWVKNSFIFLPLFFGGQITNIHLLYLCIVASGAYSFAASSIYCLNDILDVDTDKKHPQKCKRPIASGAISIVGGYIIMIIMVFLSLLTVFLLMGYAKWETLGMIMFYYIMNMAYCIKLKQIALMDVFIIAAGFVLRVILGGFATGIVLSHWIVLMTFLLALFLAFAKRRDDVIIYEETGVKPRKNINRYNIAFMNQAITIIAAVTLVCYIMYTVSDEVIQRVHSSHLYVTTIFVLAGILRYMQLTIVDIKSGSPTKVLMKDWFTQLALFLWIFSFVIILYF